jgi:hypothetical protein
MKLHVLLATAAAAAAVHVALGEQPALTIYNQNFAVVRDTVPLDLKQGVNSVRFTETTAHLEPDSVILRDPAGKVALQILEQNYRNDPVSQDLLLSMFEGQEIEFLTKDGHGNERTVTGKIIRSGYMPHAQQAIQRYGQRYGYQRYPERGPTPVIEVAGKLRFSLPGEPLFPQLGTDTILKPTIEWQLSANAAAKLNAELAYVTGGMSWEADYNVVAPEDGDIVDVIGWITMDNQSGKTFHNARIKLMAGDVSKIQPGEDRYRATAELAVQSSTPAPQVTQQAFEDYHLYTLERPTTLRDRETKQVEFVHARGVPSQRLYVYDGMKIDWARYRGYDMEHLRHNQELGNESQPKIAVMREFKNTAANQLGIPLPKGRLRFYRQGKDRQLEFTGENVIDHTPRDETVRVFTGNAFDLVGERTRTSSNIDTNRKTAVESFEIKLRNRKKEPVEITVVEHLFRWMTWEITEKTDPFLKTNAQRVEFRATVQPDEERVVKYTVRYTW